MQAGTGDPKVYDFVDDHCRVQDLSGSKVSFYQILTYAEDDAVYGLDADTLKYNASTGLFKGTASLRAADSSVFFVKDGDDIHVIKGSELKGGPEITTVGKYVSSQLNTKNLNIVASTVSGLPTIAYAILG